MKKYVVHFVLSQLAVTLAFSQTRLTKFPKNLFESSIVRTKQIIDSAAILDWTSVGYMKQISDDGNYFLYNISNQATGKNTLIVESTHENWKKEFRYSGLISVFFSENNRKVIFKIKDSLFIWALGSDAYKVLLADEINYSNSQSSVRWFTYRKKHDQKELIIYDLATDREISFLDVINYWFDHSGKSMVLITSSAEKKGSHISIKRLGFIDQQLQTIWENNSSCENVITINQPDFNSTDNQIVFLTVEKNVLAKKVFRSIWCYKTDIGKAVKLIDNSSEQIDSNAVIGSPRFSENGNWILFSLTQTAELAKANSETTKVDIWSYKDFFLQPEQERKLQEDALLKITASISTGGGRLSFLENQNESIKSRAISGDYVVVGPKAFIEPWIPGAQLCPFYVVSLKDGSRRLLKKAKDWQRINNFSFSPNNRWLVYYDKDEASYKSFDLYTSKIRNITKSIPVSFASDYESKVIHDAVSQVAGWVEGGKTLFLYDNFDVWQLDPSVQIAPINITNGYGLKHSVKFRLVNGSEDGQLLRKHTFQIGDQLIFTATSLVNRFNGFYSKKLNDKGDPELLYMGPYLFYRTQSQKDHFFTYDDGMQPVKSAKADKWVIKRQSATEAPNFYQTDDFKSFKPLSYLEPQKEYNWYTTELVTWKQFDGTMCQGVLYKPEDFNPKRKYPLLFNYYEKMSQRVNDYMQPGFTNDDINIPWFVSRGYLIFTPDIHYKIASQSGKVVGEWTYNSVVSAAQHLSHLPYVDVKRMGIQGHSFGGLETNYLITHSKIFAAAVEASGNTDAVSSYLTLVPFASNREHYSSQINRENDHELYGATPWQRPDLYRRNSAVLNADRVCVPVLIMHNERDNNIPWRQGVEFYMALRRLAKPSWMLQYEGGGHSVEGKDAIDYTFRVTQFLDHYLKNAPAPVWMTQGVPAILKQIETGYTYDPFGNCGKNCKVCQYWNDKMKRDSVMCWKEIEEKRKLEHWR